MLLVYFMYIMSKQFERAEFTFTPRLPYTNLHWRVPTLVKSPCARLCNNGCYWLIQVMMGVTQFMEQPNLLPLKFQANSTLYFLSRRHPISCPLRHAVGYTWPSLSFHFMSYFIFILRMVKHQSISNAPVLVSSCNEHVKRSCNTYEIK